MQDVIPEEIYMFEFTYEQLISIINTIIGIKDFKIIPIGNHELKRHLVYLIISDTIKPMVIKFFYKTNRRNREIAACKTLLNSGVKCNRVVDFGSLSDGTEWLLSDYIEGGNFEAIRNNIPYENQLSIFTEMGVELGRIHSIKKFDFFGNWDQECRSIDNIKTCKESFIKTMEYSINELSQQVLPDSDILGRAVDKIRGNYNILDDIKESHLRHNDFDGRNILVKKEKDKWVLNGVIDFEQSTPGNIDMDAAGLYHKYFLENNEFEKAFFEGYRRYSKLSPDFKEKLPFYLLSNGITICSWAYSIVPEYYKEGIKLVRMFV